MTYCRKHRHRSRQAAELHLRCLWSAKDPKYPGTIYYCRPCRAWHIGRNNRLKGVKK